MKREYERQRRKRRGPVKPSDAVQEQEKPGWETNWDPGGAEINDDIDYYHLGRLLEELDIELSSPLKLPPKAKLLTSM